MERLNKDSSLLWKQLTCYTERSGCRAPFNPETLKSKVTKMTFEQISLQNSMLFTWFGGWLRRVLGPTYPARKQAGEQESWGPLLANTSQLIWIRCVMFTGLRSYLLQIVRNFVHFVHGQISCYLLNCSHAALIGLHNLERVGMMYRSQEYNRGNAVPWPVSLVIRNRQAARSLYMYCRLAVRPAIVIGYTNVWFQFEG